MGFAFTQCSDLTLYFLSDQEGTYVYAAGNIHRCCVNTRHMKSHTVKVNQALFSQNNICWMTSMTSTAASCSQTGGLGRKHIAAFIWSNERRKIAHSCDRVPSEEAEVLLAEKLPSFHTRGRSRSADDAEAPRGPGLNSQLGVTHTLGSA